MPGDEYTINDVFEMHGYKPPKPWNGKRLPKFEPKTDCFGYVPPGTRKQIPKCSALNKLYCRYEECSFYKPYKLKGLKDEYKDQEET